MNRFLPSLKRKVLARALCALFTVGGFAAAPPAHAQWAVIDAINYIENMLQQLNQLDQLANDEIELMQQLKDYKLQLENLKKLPGNIRGDIAANLQRQLNNSVRDYGKSTLNKVNTLGTGAGYYAGADALISTSIGEVPREMSSVNVDLANVKLPSGQASGIGRDSFVDRQHYDRITDDLRQVAIVRENSEYRERQANEISGAMANLDSNNTVGAIQLLAAQNTLHYAQQEDAIKLQAAQLKSEQEMQTRTLVEKEKTRKQELARLAKLKTEPVVTNVKMVP